MIGERGWARPTAFSVFAAVWLLAVTFVVRTLRRRWTGSHRYPTASLFAAAFAGVAAGAAALSLTVRWQDLMSEPYPTITMIVLDLTATFSPFTASAVAAWTVLGLTDKGAPVHSSHA